MSNLSSIKELSLAAKTCVAGRVYLRRWSNDDRSSLSLVLQYVRRVYCTPGARFPRLVPSGRDLWQLGSRLVADRLVASFSTDERARQAEVIARQAAELCGLLV